MCFPRLKQCFCCCSLRTGMFFICWISLLWNLYYLYAQESTPLILQFLEEKNIIDLPDGRNFGEFSRLYYVTEIMVMTFALIGIFSNSSCCLNLLIGSETVIFLTYVFMTLYDVNICLHSNGSKSNNTDEPVLLFMISAFKYYLYLIIMSFYYEVSQGRDGRTRGGIIITAIASPYTAPPSAPHQHDLTLPSAPYVDSPYAIQPPHAPIITQPCTSIYPPNDFPHVVIQTDITPCAPPPYPVLNEKPPPYAP